LKASRLENLQESAAIFRTIIPEIAAYNPSAILLIASNPVDVLTSAALKWSGFPAGRVFGSGTSLDTSRLRRRIADHYGVAPDNAHAYIVGENGDSQVASLSAARVTGLPLAEFCRQRCISYQETALSEIAEGARTGGFEILRGKGATYYGIAAALVRIVRAILRAEHALMTVLSLVPTAMGLGELCLSLPAVIDRNGINLVVSPTLAPEEEQALQRSAEVLRAHISAITDLDSVSPGS
jgi:L-lactate dehydrogenase